ncbi:MAG: hypothetical protein U0792_02175 [Gemmataceae bacterium]
MLVACGNGGGHLTHRGQLATDLRRTLGTGVLVFDYPGYGKDGGKPSEEGATRPATRLIAGSPTKPRFPRTASFCWGNRWAAARRWNSPRGTTTAHSCWFTFTSLPAAASITIRSCRRTRSCPPGSTTSPKLPRCTKPVFIAHGTADQRRAVLAP